MIDSGFVSIDYEVTKDPEYLLKEEELIEFVDCKANVATQTSAVSSNSQRSLVEGKDDGEEESKESFHGLSGFLEKVSF